MARKVHVHREGGPPCDLPTKQACEERYNEWLAMQQVLLAYNVALRAERIREDNVFAQLVNVIEGRAEDIMNDDGNPSQSPWVIRLRRAVERVKSGDLPGYNLYTIAMPPGVG